MRNKYGTTQQQLGQFLTPQPIARLLAAMLPPGGTTLLELGAGDGSLLSAVSEKHCDLQITAVELDASMRRGLRARGLNCTLLSGDALSPRISQKLKSLSPFDYVVGNPPYALTETLGPIASVATELGLYDVHRGARLDDFFLAQSISLMAEKSAGAFILPLSLFSDNAYKNFRIALVQRFSGITVIELPVCTFGRAEVSTAICAFNNVGSKKKRIKLGKANAEGEIETVMAVGVQKAIERMDYSYHDEQENLIKLTGRNPRTLADIGAHIVRGSATSGELQAVASQYLHTSHLPSSGIGRLRYSRDTDKRFQCASSGDIVVPRVGTRCLFRQAVVLKGAVPFTECIFRIRVEPKYNEEVLESLAGPIGQAWRKLHARGACAKHITVKDLMNMPLQLG